MSDERSSIACSKTSIGIAEDDDAPCVDNMFDADVLP